MTIKNLTMATAANGTMSVTKTEERTALATIGDVVIAPIADLMADENEYVQRKTRGYAGATGLVIGIFGGEYWGQRRARAGKGPLLPFLKVA